MAPRHGYKYTPRNKTEMELTDLKGKVYLDVKWRLVWFREDHPMGSIETEIVHRDKELAIMKATIRTDNGKLLAQGTKSQTAIGFKHGYLEKAETGAIGRALAMCGYGTQFDGGELDEGDEIADAPINPRKREGKATVKAPIGEDKYAKVLAKVNLVTKGGKDQEKVADVKAKLGVSSMAVLKKWDDKKLDVALSVL